MVGDFVFRVLQVIFLQWSRKERVFDLIVLEALFKCYRYFFQKRKYVLSFYERRIGNSQKQPG